jgi:hypothetical protein
MLEGLDIAQTAKQDRRYLLVTDHWSGAFSQKGQSRISTSPGGEKRRCVSSPTDHRKQFIKMFESLAHHRERHDVFADFPEMAVW